MVGASSGAVHEQGQVIGWGLAQQSAGRAAPFLVAIDERGLKHAERPGIDELAQWQIVAVPPACADDLEQNVRIGAPKDDRRDQPCGRDRERRPADPHRGTDGECAQDDDVTDRGTARSFI